MLFRSPSLAAVGMLLSFARTQYRRGEVDDLRDGPSSDAPTAAKLGSRTTPRARDRAAEKLGNPS